MSTRELIPTTVEAADLGLYAPLHFHLGDDFIPPLSSGWDTSGGVGGGTVAIPTGTHYLQLVTGTSTNDFKQAITQSYCGNMVQLPRVASRVRLVSVTTLRVLRVGLFVVGSSPEDLFGFEHNSAAGGNWRLTAEGGAGAEALDTGVAVAADTWHTVEMAGLSPGQIAWAIRDIRDEVLGSGVWTLASPMTSTSDTALRIMSQTLTTAARTSLVDYVALTGGRHGV